ncbi:hypothetical protein RB628_09625 [Streptomyces sp. ADMS]|uniref:hypothetical protein n=1 Tax=Streptomyces sp. ADMS TaxID=3071415 RepID=UPI00296F5E6C|nr:hypothetical protein [Streptomyces sp. ADMS]MDW4905598.1 hypothetical protein [Streptomyces sp. ADMS]
MTQRLIDEAFYALDETTGSARRPSAPAQHTGMQEPLIFWREPATWRPSRPFAPPAGRRRR